MIFPMLFPYFPMISYDFPLLSHDFPVDFSMFSHLFQGFPPWFSTLSPVFQGQVSVDAVRGEVAPAHRLHRAAGGFDPPRLLGGLRSSRSSKWRGPAITDII